MENACLHVKHSGDASKQDLAALIRHALTAAAAVRHAAGRDPVLRSARLAVRQFQAARMAATHDDLLKAPETHPAAQFFLADLYSTEDLSARDASLERIVPAMERLLPAAALSTVARAVALDALSEQLDAEMAKQLGDRFDEADYVAAYRTSGTRADRDLQIAHVESVGHALCDLVRVPLISGTLVMMRGPAKMAGLGELQNFLERGFKAFKGMKNPTAFVDTVVRRERDIMSRLYAGDEQPFDVV